MVNITKKFHNLIANNKVYFNLKKGEVHALLGENGAGKTTLMNILFGLYRPDSGEIYVKGKKVQIRSPRDAISLGIGMVHQHFLFVEEHTVAENLALSYSRNLLNPKREVEEGIKIIEERYGIKVDLGAYIWQLSLGEQQKVEILKVLLSGADILILDEPTSVLTPTEVEELFNSLRRMRSDGKGIVFITHKLNEVFEIADRITVMRNGSVVATVNTQDVTREELARMMVSRDFSFKPLRSEVSGGSVVLDVRDLVILGDRGDESVRGVSFQVKSGEILGVGGVAGNGQSELAQSIVGLRRVRKGRILIDGIDVTNRSPREIHKLGVAYVPEDRLKYGIVREMSLAENSVLKTYYERPFSSKYILKYSKVVEFAERIIEEFGLAAPSVHIPVKNLSGGNIQRLVVGRELIREPKLIIASNPTQGLDVAASEYIRSLLIAHRNNGSAILLISSDLDELLELSDRVAVMFRGKFAGIFRPGEVSAEQLGLMMSGGLRIEVS
ncbi:MAG: ABC transporter ATP-binding protein [Candidatus Korarchaeum sp.]|nr:ABC transporter ATP-binding protein [Candidatus Korarchaeum sp.]MDW8035600.1 ABC transporter ATP-binding protein [Candidatus Korarchaeum sp.]